MRINRVAKRTAWYMFMILGWIFLAIAILLVFIGLSSLISYSLFGTAKFGAAVFVLFLGLGGIGWISYANAKEEIENENNRLMENLRWDDE